VVLDSSFGSPRPGQATYEFRTDRLHRDIPAQVRGVLFEYGDAIIQQWLAAARSQQASSCVAPITRNWSRDTTTARTALLGGRRI